MAATAASELSEGPVLSLINKRLRALRKKLNRILQMEESLSQGKPLNKEQEDVLRSKPGVVILIDELDKLRQTLSVAVQEELTLSLHLHHHHHHQVSVPLPATDLDSCSDAGRVWKGLEKESEIGEKDESGHGVVEDLLHLLYFGNLFDVKPQSEYTSTMLTRTHERGCCLTYDYVTGEDDAAAVDLLGERDLDSISMLGGGLLISRPVNSSLSHKDALQGCIERAKLWLSKSDRPIVPESSITYAALRERLDKIMASYYFTTVPEIKAPVEMAAAAAAGNYSSLPMPVVGSLPIQVEGSVSQHQQKDEDAANFEGHESGNFVSISGGEVHKDESEMEKPADVSTEQEQVKPQVEVEQNQRDVKYQRSSNTLPGEPIQTIGVVMVVMVEGVARRGYFNGCGGRNDGGAGGAYQNVRNQYYDQPVNYYPRNYYSNNKGRGGKGAGGQSHYNHASAPQVGHTPADVKLAS